MPTRSPKTASGTRAAGLARGAITPIAATAAAAAAVGLAGPGHPHARSVPPRRARPPHAAVAAACLALLVVARPAHAERLKELTTLMGARANQLLGYGLVVGLENTGDSYYAGIGMQSVATMLRHLGVQSDPNFLRLRNVASVMVIAEQAAFAAPGQRMDVTVSSIGDARTLEGGTLLASPLKGSDLRVYAVAQGPVAVGGFSASGMSRSRLQKNFTTVGRIPGGAIVERDIPVDLPQERMSISLRSPDFTTAVRIGEAIDARLRTLAQGAGQPAAAPAAGGQPGAEATPEPWAVARDSGTVLVRVPPTFLGRIPKLMSELEALEVTPDGLTRVVINERTGTVVLGDATRLAPVAIAHGGLTLEVREQPVVSQPGPFSQTGETRVVARTNISAQETVAPLRDLAPGASLGEVVKALNTLGVAPRDMVSILQALKASGALRAELEIL